MHLCNSLSFQLRRSAPISDTGQIPAAWRGPLLRVEQTCQGRRPSSEFDPKRKFGLLGIDPTALLSVATGA
jgi:hypothetical protein